MADVVLVRPFRLQAGLVDAIVARPWLKGRHIRVLLVILERADQAATLEHIGQSRSYPPVHISAESLARAAGVRPGGSFRAVLDELEAGSVLVVEHGAGSRPSAYIVQRHLTQWSWDAPRRAEKASAGRVAEVAKRF